MRELLAELNAALDRRLPCVYCAVVETRDNSRHARNVIETETRCQRSVASNDQRWHFRLGLAQGHRTPLQAVQMLCLAARSLPDLRFARLPQPQAANACNHMPVAIGKLQMSQRVAIAAALDRGSHPQLARTGRKQRHIRPLER